MGSISDGLLAAVSADVGTIQAVIVKFQRGLLALSQYAEQNGFAEMRVPDSLTIRYVRDEKTRSFAYSGATRAVIYRPWIEPQSDRALALALTLPTVLALREEGYDVTMTEIAERAPGERFASYFDKVLARLAERYVKEVQQSAKRR